MTSAATDIDGERLAFLGWAFGSFERFCGLLDIVGKSGGRQKFRLNAIQKKFCGERTGRDVVLKPRQVGFSTLELARDVYTFLTVPGSRVVVVCQSITGDGPIGILSATVRLYFDSLRRQGVKLEFSIEKVNEWHLAGKDSTLRIIVAGASEAAASKVGRAGTITRCHITEAGFFEYADETMNALLECVPGPETGSEIVIESTPNGATGLFYQQCMAAKRGDSSYKLHFYPWYLQSEYSAAPLQGQDVEPRTDKETSLVRDGISPGQLLWYQRKVAEKGQDRTDQEYPSDPDTCFLISGRGFFDQGVTSALVAASTEPLELRDRGRVSVWKLPECGAEYLVAVDPSEGGGGDPSGAVVYESDTGEHVATILGQYTPWDLADAAHALAVEFNEALIVVERNNHGHAVLQSLQREHRYKHIYSHSDTKPGWPTNTATRPTMLDALEDAHRQGHWTTPDRNVLIQMRTFVVGDTGRAEAARGEHDDLVMAAAIGWAVRQRPRVKNAYTRIRQYRAGLPKARD